MLVEPDVLSHLLCDACSQHTAAPHKVARQHVERLTTVVLTNSSTRGFQQLKLAEHFRPDLIFYLDRRRNIATARRTYGPSVARTQLDLKAL